MWCLGNILLHVCFSPNLFGIIKHRIAETANRETGSGPAGPSQVINIVYMIHSVQAGAHFRTLSNGDGCWGVSRAVCKPPGHKRPSGQSQLCSTQGKDQIEAESYS